MNLRHAGLAALLVGLTAIPLPASAQDGKEQTRIWGRLTFDLCTASWYSNRDITDASTITVGYRTHYNDNGWITGYERVTRLDSAGESGLCLRRDESFCVNAEMTARYSNGRLDLMSVRDGAGSALSETRLSYGSDGALEKITVVAGDESSREVHYYNENRVRMRSEHYLGGRVRMRHLYHPFCRRLEQQPFRRSEEHGPNGLVRVREYDQRGNLIVREDYNEDTGELVLRSEVNINDRGHWVETRNFAPRNGKVVFIERLQPIFGSSGELERIEYYDAEGNLLNPE